LYASQAQRGARLILMKFDDNRETRKITTKLVWQSSNASGVNRAASAYPDYVSRLSFGIVQFDGPETYIQEVGGIFDSAGGSIDVPYLVAMGFSVSDIGASRTFYTSGLGMDESPTGTFPVTDATGSATITEYTVKHVEGAGLVLQDWRPARNSKDNPVKVVLFVPDAQAAADDIVSAGGFIVEEATRSPVYDNRLLIVAKDLDGYLLELVQ
jgi:predicted enzyme related to lactoylglutathione lyase